MKSNKLYLILALLSAKLSSIAMACTSVVTYGANPNDSLDDSPAIQSAVDSLPNNGCLGFPAGNPGNGYILWSPITVKTQYATLRGDGHPVFFPNKNKATPFQGMAVFIFGDSAGLDNNPANFWDDLIPLRRTV